MNEDSYRDQYKRPIIDFYVGVDLGQANDYTALSIIEVTRGYRGLDEGGHYVDYLGDPEEFKYNVTWLERFRRGTPYPKQVKFVQTTIANIPVSGKGTVARGDGRVFLVVDKTGVGVAVFDIMVAAGLKPVGITITGGNQVISTPEGYNVPKKDLITNLQVLQQQRRLEVAPDLEDAETLSKELMNFRHKITLKGQDTFEAWRENDHDDLVLSCAISSWYASQQYDNEFYQYQPGNPLYDAYVNYTGK